MAKKANNYVYKESKITTKKLAGIYDAERHAVCVDGLYRDILKELEEFNGVDFELAVTIKETTDLLEDTNE